uniref:ATP synthase complex subunit 8 n=1 Tax=Bavayia robusta TaxID=942151 RepID=A0A1W7HP23_9SAUR|nr:ATP synthase F0 subunit 8 [Bavayia robusta]BAX39020.1 ATP synthase F0 subunit 8 [Bavayia robusta]
MPQLNPAPWFLTFLTAWTILLILLAPKLLKMHFPTEPKLDTNTKPHQPWTWPWF